MFHPEDDVSRKHLKYCCFANFFVIISPEPGIPEMLNSEIGEITAAFLTIEISQFFTYCVIASSSDEVCCFGFFLLVAKY